MTLRLSPAEAARLGISPAKTGKRGPAKTTVIPARVWAAYGIPEPVAEYRFCERRWRFDYAWPTWRTVGKKIIKVALEIDGGAHTRGRHTRGKGFVSDQAKFNRATIDGWRVLHCVPGDVKSGAIFGTIKMAMGIEG